MANGHSITVIILGFLALIVRSTFVSEFPTLLIPDVSFLLVIIAARYLKPVVGILVACLLGYITDLLSESPAGYHAFLRLIVFYLTVTFHNQFQLDRLFVFVPFVFVISFFDSIGAWILMDLIGTKTVLTLYGVGGMMLLAIVNALSAPVIKGSYDFFASFLGKGNRTKAVDFSSESR